MAVSNSRSFEVGKKQSTFDLGAPQWSELNKLGQSKSLKYSWVWLVLTPVMGKALSAVESVKIPFFGPDFVIQASLPFSWHILFFSSLAFAAANLIYILKCPLIVRRYDRYTQMKQDLEADVACEVAILTSYFEGLVCNYPDDLELAQSHADQWETDFRDPATTNNIKIEIGKERQLKVNLDYYQLLPTHQKEAFHRAYIQCDLMHPNYRTACRITYFLGFILLGILVMQNTFFVIKQLS